MGGEFLQLWKQHTELEHTPQLATFDENRFFQPGFLSEIAKGDRQKGVL